MSVALQAATCSLDLSRCLQLFDSFRVAPSLATAAVARFRQSVLASQAAAR